MMEMHLSVPKECLPHGPDNFVAFFGDFEPIFTNNMIFLLFVCYNNTKETSAQVVHNKDTLSSITSKLGMLHIREHIYIYMQVLSITDQF